MKDDELDVLTPVKKYDKNKASQDDGLYRPAQDNIESQIDPIIDPNLRREPTQNVSQAMTAGLKAVFAVVLLMLGGLIFYNYMNPSTIVPASNIPVGTVPARTPLGNVPSNTDPSVLPARATHIQPENGETGATIQNPGDIVQ